MGKITCTHCGLRVRPNVVQGKLDPPAYFCPKCKKRIKVWTSLPLI